MAIPVLLLLLAACTSVQGRSSAEGTFADRSLEAGVGEQLDRAAPVVLGNQLGARVDPKSAERQILLTVKLRASWRPPRAGTSGTGYSSGYRASARTRQVVSRLAEKYELRELSNWPIRPLGVYCVVFEVPESSEPEEILTRLKEDDRVESVQPMNLFEIKSDRYNDPYLGLQHGVSSMQIEEAHRWARGEGVRIAVVDTGVDLDHPELREHILLAKDFVTEAGDQPSADRHGTAVAGVIVSTADNGIGIVGVAPDARILALRACWQEEDDSPRGRCSSFTLAKALTFAIEQRPDILNLSLAGPSDPLLERLMRAALDRRILVVAAAGALPADSFPSSIDGVVAVRSADEPAERTGLATTARNDLAAPGTDILTTMPAGQFDFLSGRSLATAHVSGVAALLLERQPRLTGAELLALLRDTSASDPSNAAAAPIVNACKALSRIAQGPECSTEGTAPATSSTAADALN